jgi:hypothetical protein
MKGKFYMKKILLIFILLISNYGCYNSKTTKPNWERDITRDITRNTLMLDGVIPIIQDSCSSLLNINSEVSCYDFNDVNQYDYFALYYDTIGFDDDMDITIDSYREIDKLDLNQYINMEKYNDIVNKHKDN